MAQTDSRPAKLLADEYTSSRGEELSWIGNIEILWSWNTILILN
jgi:hypothetical protein